MFGQPAIKSSISAGAVARYMLLPGIFPWLRRIGAQFAEFFSIFANVLIYSGLVERSHPVAQAYLQGRVGFVALTLAAWDNLTFDRKHVPDILMFAVVMLSYVLFFAVIGIGLIYAFSYTGIVHAQYMSMPENAGIAYNPDKDWAFQFLERLFGGKQFTGINFWAQAETDIGNIWYIAILTGMLKAYSKALMLVASMMILYILVVTLADAARTGRPFGEKFDGIWAPLRFALAMGLLMPVPGAEYNGGQMIVFKVAEVGSNIATNVWQRAILDMGECATDDPSYSKKETARKCNFVTAGTTYEQDYKFLRDMFLINSCISGYNASMEMSAINDRNGLMGIVKNTQEKNRDLYSFGNKFSPAFCGSVVLPLPLSEADVPSGYKSGTTDGALANYAPALIVDGYRTAALRSMMMPASTMLPVTNAFAREAFCKQDQILMNVKCDGTSCADQQKEWIRTHLNTAYARKTSGTDEEKSTIFANYEPALRKYNSWITESLKRDAEAGWATAGVFYLRLTNAIANLTTAIETKPYVSQLPVNMYRTYASPKHPLLSDNMAEVICGGFLAKDSMCGNMAAFAALSLHLSKSGDWFRDAPRNDLKFYQELGGYNFRKALIMPDTDTVEGESVETATSWIAQKLFDMFKITRSDMNPLAVVVNWGNNMLNIAYSAYGLGMLFSVLSYIPTVGAIMMMMAKICMAIGNIFIVPGFILFLVVPFLPFMYFTFAVVEWMVSIMEAAIGMPLWALTFIRREGGLFEPAMKGVQMLAEIMLRPTLIIMSLIVAVIIFNAGATFFSDAMELYMGAYSESVNDGFLFGIGMVFIYVFGIYSLATSSFKLMEHIPNKFGRWGFLPTGYGGIVNMGVNSKAVAMSAIYAANEMKKVTAALPGVINPGKSKAAGGDGDDGTDDPDGGDDEKKALREEIERLRAALAMCLGSKGGGGPGGLPPAGGSSGGPMGPTWPGGGGAPGGLLPLPGGLMPSTHTSAMPGSGSGTVRGLLGAGDGVWTMPDKGKHDRNMDHFGKSRFAADDSEYIDFEEIKDEPPQTPPKPAAGTSSGTGRSGNVEKEDAYQKLMKAFDNRELTMEKIKQRAVYEGLSLADMFLRMTYTGDMTIETNHLIPEVKEGAERKIPKLTDDQKEVVNRLFKQAENQGMSDRETMKLVYSKLREFTRKP